MFNWLLDWIFPKQCIGCTQWDTWLCQSCLNKCIRPSQAKKSHGIKNLYYLNNYQDQPILQKSIHELKYSGIKDLGVTLGQELAKFIPHHYNYVIPIPLHRRRWRERGFNQSAVIAAQLGIPLLPALQRVRYTTPQAQLNRDQRLNNLQRAFAIVPSYQPHLQQAHILLVDDVYTTGTTMNTCAAMLYQSGTQHVDGAVLALD